MKQQSAGGMEGDGRSHGPSPTVFRQTFFA